MIDYRDFLKKLAKERSAADVVPPPPAPVPEVTSRDADDILEDARSPYDVRVRDLLIVRGIFKQERREFYGAFMPGERVTLERDPENPYDPYAVKVLLSDGSMLGFVAKEFAQKLTYDLSDGWKYKVRVADGPIAEDKWGQCVLEVTDKIPPA